jgi:hypothetical protein
LISDLYKFPSSAESIVERDYVILLVAEAAKVMRLSGYETMVTG